MPRFYYGLTGLFAALCLSACSPDPQTTTHITRTPDTPSARTASVEYASVCASCHGPGAHGEGFFPALAGKPAEYLANRLHRYRAGETLGAHSEIMRTFAAPLQDEQITRLANWLATLPAATLRP